MPPKQTHKLYCHVDETGQDTQGGLYVVAIVVSITPKEQLFDMLEKAETASGKGKRKWHHNSVAKREAYIAKAFYHNLQVGIYYQIFDGPELSYELATIQATATAIRAYLQQENIKNYKATIIIDGLHRSVQGTTAKQLRGLGIRTKTVRGERDERSAAIRLADAVAGIIREIYEGETYFKAICEDLERKGVIHHIP